MKKIGLSLMGIAMAILVLYVVFLQECRRPPGYQIPKGKVLVSQGFLDSLVAIANLPPDTIPGDTVRIKGDIVYVPKRIPVPYPVALETNLYTDSIVNDSINVWTEITTHGTIEKWYWKYKPIIFEIETIIERPVSKPVPYEVPVFKTGLYVSLRVGGGFHDRSPSVCYPSPTGLVCNSSPNGKFLFGADLDLVTKKRSIYGIQYTRFGDENLIAFRFGTKLFGK